MPVALLRATPGPRSRRDSPNQGARPAGLRRVSGVTRRISVSRLRRQERLLGEGAGPSTPAFRAGGLLAVGLLADAVFPGGSVEIGEGLTAVDLVQIGFASKEVLFDRGKMTALLTARSRRACAARGCLLGGWHGNRCGGQGRGMALLSRWLCGGGIAQNGVELDRDSPGGRALASPARRRALDFSGDADSGTLAGRRCFVRDSFRPAIRDGLRDGFHDGVDHHRASRRQGANTRLGFP